MTYVIRFWNKGQTEEYDGGATLSTARAEAAFFKKHLAPDTEIKICKLKTDRAFLVEVL